MFRGKQLNQALVAASGLAVTASAQAFMFTQSPSPVLIAASQTVTLFSGFASGTAGVFTFQFGYDDFGDSSWASDMRIDVIDPNSNTVSIGGYGSFPNPVSYQGSASDPAGIYGDSINLTAFGLTGAGIWTITITNDWAGDPNSNEIGGGIFTGLVGGNNPFTGTLEGVVIPTPGAVGLFGVAGIMALRRRR